MTYFKLIVIVIVVVVVVVVAVVVVSPMAKVINYAMATTVGKRSKELYYTVKKKLGFVEDVVVIVRRVKKIKKTVGKQLWTYVSTPLNPHRIFPSYLSILCFRARLTLILFQILTRSLAHSLTHSLALIV